MRINRIRVRLGNQAKVVRFCTDGRGFNPASGLARGRAGR